MMCSLEKFQKFRGELNQLLTEGGNLSEDEESFLEFLINTADSKGVLEFIRGLKEEGNDCFKQKLFDEALEKYGYAGIISARYVFDEEVRMVECFNLAICLLLNFAACFSKKGGFEQVGRICTFVLDFSPENVKALYRRAMAAIELGRNVIAYWDLQLAHELNPDNQEVLRKLKQVEKSLSTATSKKHQHNASLEELGTDLSSPRKKAKNKTRREDENDQISDKKNVSEVKEIVKLQRIGGDIDKETIEKEGVKEIDENMEEVPKKDKNEVLNNESLHQFVNEQVNFEKMAMVDEDKDQQMKENNDVFDVKNKCDQAESIYRFSNRRRPGSFLSISRKNYELLQRGHDIRCVNAKMNSIIMIRVVRQSSSQQDESKAKCDQMDWHGPFQKDFGNHENVIDLTQPLVEEGTETEGNNGVTNKRTNVSLKNHTSKRKRKRMSHLFVSASIMKTAKSCSLKKHRRRRSIIHQRTPNISASTCSLSCQAIRDSKIGKERILAPLLVVVIGKESSIMFLMFLLIKFVLILYRLF